MKLKEFFKKHILFCRKTLSYLQNFQIPGKLSKESFGKPFITVSREAGSGGRPLAKHLAKKLNYDFYDEKLVDLISKKLGKKRRLITSLDEKQRNRVADMVKSMVDENFVTRDKYIKALCEVVLGLAQKGGCVILGRGANFITSFEDGLHLRVIAPYLKRVEYSAKYEGYSELEARQRIKRFDKERKEFVRRYFGKNPSNTNYYDLVLNTDHLTIKQATSIALKALKRKFPKRT